MLNENFKDALKIIQKRLTENNIKYAVVGSTNMQLQGMNVQPHDLDIVVRLQDLEKIREIFSDYKASDIKELKPLTDELSWEVRAEIEGVQVQVFGQKNTGEYVRKLLANQMTQVRLDNIEVPCFTLEAEAQTYSETNRKHKTQLIQEFLKQNNP